MRYYKIILTYIWTTIKVVRDIYHYKKGIVVMGVLFSLFFSLAALANIHTSKWLINSLNNTQFKLSVLIFLLITLLNLVKNIIADYQELKYEEYAFKISLLNQEKLIKATQRISLREKEHSVFQSELSIASRGVTMYFGYFRGFIQMGESILTSVTTLLFLFQYSLYLGLSVGAIALFKAIIISKIVNKKVELTRDLQEHEREPQYFYNLLTNVPTQKELKVYGINDFLLKKWNDVNYQVQNLRRKLHLIKVKNNLGQHLFSQISLAAVVIMIIVLLSENRLTLGDYFALTLALNLADSSMTTLIRNIVQGVEDTFYIQDFQKFIRKEIDVENDNEQKSAFQFNNEIEIKNLSFRYPNSIRNSLDNINLKIKKGQKVVILGENGSGKSTLLKLIAGLYEAPENTIFYDGASQHCINKSTLYKNMFVAFQDFTKYMLTVKENITFGRDEDNEDSEKLLKAIHRAGFKDLHILPDGLTTRLGYLTKGSVNLSGGQWQKLVLARGYYNESNFLLLDEPTAAIDPESEMNYLEDIFFDKSKTVIVITHRINITNNADFIILMKDGRIEESGTHKELLRNESGVYKRIWEKQSSILHLEERERAITYG
ncbi:ABC transporter ATP-binding protein [Lysinibacillus fusiformis]|jgi:ATP-binding cassette subfamily B protein|uniref:ABC transporter ATP-binding protein n=1 Tax=Lysinibacillus sp. PWR01 TaxID=3342384 RepID=UPI00372CFAED